MKIVLDAGHGYNTAGKRTPNGVNEWSLNNKVCKLITTKLKEYGVDIIRTDDTTGNTDISLLNRAKKCNEVKPALMISIHHNAFKGKWGNHTGTEVLMHTFGTKQDKELASILAPLLSSKCRLVNRGVKKALLGVLSCKCTAVLCEGGFMDSNIDNSVICSLEGQNSYANAVTEAVVKYLGLKKITNID
jgi:N-acetylmuramoyl-L-alanine amidase